MYFAGEGQPLKGPVALKPGAANENPKFFGPEIGIGEVLGKQFPSDKIVLLKISWGGTALQGASSDLVWLDGALYTDWFQPNLKLALSKLSDKSAYPDGFRISGIFWMQGESDACDPAKSESGKYSSALKTFVEARLRVELAKNSGQGSYIPVPFVYSMISPYWPFAGSLWLEQLAAQRIIPNAKCTELGKTAPVYHTLPGTVEYESGMNQAHYNSEGILAVGRGMGDAYVRLAVKGDQSFGCTQEVAGQDLLLR